MSSTRIALLGSACLLATVSLANADEFKLSNDQLDHVTAGATSLLDDGSSILDSGSGFCTFCPAPAPDPDPTPDPDPVPDVPDLGGFFGDGLFGGLFGGGSLSGGLLDFIEGQIGNQLAGLN